MSLNSVSCLRTYHDPWVSRAGKVTPALATASIFWPLLNGNTASWHAVTGAPHRLLLSHFSIGVRPKGGRVDVQLLQSLLDLRASTTILN